jgi:hypothetical protein
MTRTSKTLIVLSALAGLAGCAYQDPLRLPNPYPSYGGGSRSYSPYGVDPLYYYGYGMTDPFYYRYGYPAYGYYPQYPVHTCVDANRDGRCDRRHDDHDNDDGDHDDQATAMTPARATTAGGCRPIGAAARRAGQDVNDRPARARPEPSPGAPGMAPRPQPSTPKYAVAPRTDPRSRDPAAQP